MKNYETKTIEELEAELELEFQYKPLKNMIVFETIRIQEKTRSGIFKPATVVDEEKNTIGSKAVKVIAVGPDTKTVKVGDYIQFSNIARPRALKNVVTNEITHGIECEINVDAIITNPRAYEVYLKKLSDKFDSRAEQEVANERVDVRKASSDLLIN